MQVFVDNLPVADIPLSEVKEDYVPQQAELLFQIVCARYERGTIMITSNKYFSDWGELMSDSVIATAILDRLLYHAHVINIRGESYRLKDCLRAGLNPAVPQPGLRKTGLKDFLP